MKLIVCAVATVAASLTGCVATSPDWESTFGDSVRQARAAQVIDPNAPTRNAGAGLGTTDGKVVEGAQKAYAESYGYGVKESKQAPVVNVNTSGR